MANGTSDWWMSKGGSAELTKAAIENVLTGEINSHNHPAQEVEFPLATETEIGGIKAAARTSGETQEVKIDLVTGKLYSTPPGAATNGIPAGGSTGQILSKKSGNDYDTQWGTIALCPERWCIPSGTDLGYDDEFSDGAIDANWIPVDKPGSVASWYEPVNIKGLSVVAPASKGTTVISAILKPLDSLTYPLYIETAILQTAKEFNYPASGLILADGTTYGAGKQILLGDVNHVVSFTALTNFNTRSSFVDCARETEDMLGRIYMRLFWSESNKFSAYFSPDGIVWYKSHSDISITMTPTHFGLAQINYGSAPNDVLANFAYIRVRSGIPING